MSGLAPLTLILGGARSGKSRYAESLVEDVTPPWTYIATAQIYDNEMHARVDRHRARRGNGWQPLEEPLDLPVAFGEARGNVILVDCLTLWLSNLMLAGRPLAQDVVAFEEALAKLRVPAVLVANEVGLGIVPETPLGRNFRDEAGFLHQRLAKRADSVILMVAGLPLTVK